MLQHLQWLWAMHLARQHYRCHGLLFSRRKKFLARLAPKIQGGRIAYPDAIFFIKPADVRRAKLEAA